MRVISEKHEFMMKDIATFLKFLYFYAGHSHRFCGRNSYLADHAYLGELYEAYDDAYDGIIERMIGLKQNVDEFEIVAAANDLFQKFAREKVVKNATYFVNIYGFEKQLINLLTDAAKDASLGTNDMLAGMASDSESRQYKIGQRIDAEAI